MTLEEKKQMIADSTAYLIEWFDITSNVNDGPCLEDVVSEILTDFERRLSKTEE